MGTPSVGLAEISFAPFDLPSSLEEGYRTAVESSHLVKLARLDEELARIAVATERASATPRASLDLSMTGGSNTQFEGSGTLSGQVAIRLSAPVWSGGQVQSRIRAGEAEVEAARLQALETEAEVREQLLVAVGNYQAAQAAVVAARLQVTASSTARTGAELEQRLGLRNTLDLLNQEQEALEARVNLANSQRDLVVTQAIVQLQLGVDPTGNLTEATRFDVMRLDSARLPSAAGRPAIWERPLIFLADVLAPVDQASRAIARDGSRIMGQEQ
jgi:outer membrane protein